MRIGILGAGQLGRMMALAGYPHGHEFFFYDLSGAPSAGVGQTLIDPDGSQMDRFLDQVDLVTYEFEHLPLAWVEKMAAKKPLYPSTAALQACQNRIAEKTLFAQLGIATPAWRAVHNADELAAAASALGCPVVAKSVTQGYDGKGQAVLRSPDEAHAAWAQIGHEVLIVESFVDFIREISVIAVRGRDGDIAIYPLAENLHHQGILRYSIAPAPALSASIQSQAEASIRLLLTELQYVGVLTLELFETANGLLANEMAPRVHNSGHWTQQGAVVCQFENHLRAITGMPLGSVEAKTPTCMINMIGREGRMQDLLRLPYLHLHRYNKAERAGRKLGHVNITAPDYRELLWRARNAACLLPDLPELKCSLDR